MDLSIFLNMVAAAIGFFFILRKIRSHQENKEFDLSSLSTSSPPSSLTILSVPRSVYWSSLSPSSPPSSLSISSAPRPSSSQVWIHDVFLSFRGEDVRNNFLSHIQKEFKRKGITYFNDNGIKRGESIAPELIRGIRGSKIVIVLLSRNYGSSKWCLEELVEIMKCREELKQTVMAIFCKVDPSDVKKLTGDFGKVFRKTCEGQAKEDIWRWKQALEKVATIAGYHPSNWDDEASMVEEIATNVSNDLINFVISSDFEGFAGMEAHMKKMEPFLLLGSNEVRIIGIWGPSGIGKSTIARVLFSQHSHEFQLSVFMENIKRRCPRPCSDEYSAKLKLQEEFLSKIINQEDVKIHHLGVAPDRLKDKRVLVVLDDVDHLMQLDAMAKDHSWFGPGSRIIVTTQDKKILTAHGINHIYKVEYPGFSDAFEIFCMYAFGQKSPYDGFEKLAWEVKEFAGNLPLGLKVMGSYFKGMLKHEWEEELPRLSARLDGEIESSLKLRYDALSVDTQDLFLHLACFFNNERIEKVEEYLARNIVGVKGQLRVLAEKSFISIVGGYIKIHDLLARLGREIVRKQSIHEPGQRQFLADVGDICQVLQNDTLGSRSVIGIDLKLLELETELKISERAFERMSNVQFLRLLLSDSDSDSGSDYGRPKQTCHHSIDLMTCLPPNLKLLHWDFFPMTCLPSNFISEFLVEIALRKSNYLEKLWEGNKTIRNLKWMYLSDSKNLKELPDLSTATSLQELNLHGCSNLAELPFSIGNVISLRRLNLSHCSSLVRIPSFIWNLINLGRLDISHCSSLVRLPSSSGNAIIKLKVLDLSGCTSLMELPSSMENATDLEELNLTGCLRLAKLPSSIGNLKKLYLKDCSSLVELPSSVRNSINLKDFTFNGCSNLVELPFYLGNATDLKKIDLSGCSSLQELPSSIGNMTNLMHLYLDECSSLLELPSSIGNMTSLLYLYLNECSSLVELPSSIGNINNLMKLHLNGCSSLVELPSSIGNMNNLGNLYLNGCSSLVELPSSIGNINHLRKLSLNGCSSLVELPSSIGHMNHLRKLYLERCSKLRALPININMKSLGKLFLTDCSSLKCVPEISTNISVLKLTGTSIEELPRSIMSWPRLRELHLSDTRIQEIAPWVKERSSLRELVIKGCTKLVSLPQLPDSLKFLVADNCGSLERLDCSFYKTKFHGLSFVNCFGLNQEAREIIINTWTRDFAIFPGETVPTYFNYRATRSSLSMTWNGLDTQYFPTSLRFKACLLLVYKGDVDADDWCWPDISYCIKDKLNSVKSGYAAYADLWHRSSPTSKEHLLVFKIEEKVGSPELAFEFRSHDKNWEIEECGLRPLESWKQLLWNPWLPHVHGS
ncbi:disease resistance protein TAO1-like [Brassica napus]|uniref:disease resistance protein TAO1-like n=1 Tax=Brassica napus TaxID=3708 RepID=UPI002078AE48|nr:disease resistance protein TAO1-like [Brassica napus]